MSAPSADANSSALRTDPAMILAIVLSALLCLSLTGFVLNYTQTLSDFSAFYTAGALAAAGEAASAYDLESLRAAYRVIFPDAPDGYGWFYPPHTFLLHEPLAALPFPVARAVWLIATFGLYLLAIRPWLKTPLHWMFAVAAPAMAFHWHAGQTGFLVAALLALALHGLMRSDRRGDVIAGIAIGFLTLKPHLWLLLPVFLLIEGRWRIIIVASLTTLGLCAISVLAYGIEPWIAMASSALSGYTTNHGDELRLFARMGNIAGLLSYLGLEGYSLLITAPIALVAIAMMILLKRNQAPLAIRIAFAVAACFVIAPHNMIYDQTLFVPVVAMLIAARCLQGRTPLVYATALLVAWPALYAFVPGLSSVPLSLFVVLGFAAALLQKAYTAKRAAPIAG